MSHKTEETLDEIRILGSENEVERFSDRCAACGHSRADHLVSPMAPHVHAISDCNMGDCPCHRFGDVSLTNKAELEKYWDSIEALKADNEVI